MASESATSSWHPAMMPNSLTDRTEEPSQDSSHFGALPEQIQATEASNPDSNTSTPPADTDPPRRNEVPVQDPSIAGIKDNGDDAELNSLRNALTTSLSSPGGVELQESPVHKSVDPADHFDDEIDFPLAEFPSEGPKHENKHLSTMSFARTVSDDVSWGEDDDVDPEWNSSKDDTNPFKMLAKSDRTNSFPAVPPLHNPAQDNGEETMVQSQAESIMNAIEQEPREMFGDDTIDENASFSHQAANPNSTSEASTPLESGQAEESLPAYGRSYGGDYEQAQDQDTARYEEGVPLFQHEEVQNNGQGSSAFLGDVETGEGDDFFAQVSRSKDTEQQETSPPAVLERKSTMQVMDSLHLQPQDDILDTPIEPKDEQQTSFHRATGGGIAASASTIISQVIGELDVPVHENSKEGVPLELDAVEADLAEKWKAALAGDEFLDDEDDELLPDDEPVESGRPLDPSALFGSDDEGFLDDPDEPAGSGTGTGSGDFFAVKTPTVLSGTNGYSPQTARPTSSSNRYLPAGSSNPPAPLSAHNYAPAAPLLMDLSKPTAAPMISTPYSAGLTNSSQSQQPRPDMPKAQSFANRSKGGYQSPYDLPMEVVKPRKRASMQNMGRGFSNASLASVPPPRSSSMNPQAMPPPRGTSTALSPPTSSNGPVQQNQFQQPKASSTVPARPSPSASGFFEDLPVSSRPKPAPRNSSYAPIPSANSYGQPSAPPQNFTPTNGQSVHPAQYQQQPLNPISAPPAGLVAPDRVSPYASLPSNPVVAQPSTASRYSPAPPQLQPSSQSAPPPVAQSRYSPAPPIALSRQQSQPYVQPPILAHQPRTSSPLAQFERNPDPRSHRTESTADHRVSSSGYESNLRSNTLPPMKEVDENEASLSTHTIPNNSHPSQPLHSMHPPPRTPPPAQAFTARPSLSPSKRSSYLPQQPPQARSEPPSFMPPRRSLTQSPGSALSGPRLEMNGSAPYQRPASVEIPTSPRNQTGFSTFQPIAPPVNTTQNRTRAASRSLNFVVPNDGREHDPLQRWKGAPVFAWGVGGTLVTSFPKDVPRYGMNQNVPMIIRSPGEVKIANIKTVDPLPERLTSFPGPLKGKSKKKDVINWLNAGVALLEQDASYLRTLHNLSHEDKRLEERILLWKILRVFIENDGMLEGNPAVDKAVRDVMSPGLDDNNASETAIYATGADLSGISQSSNSASRSDPVDPTSVDQLRKHLLRGEREKAVWEAVDKRLWAHAMLISNTVSRDLYRQVAQEFVQKEVRNIGDNTESLAALYEIFAGNFEESIDELVPPSARAGFQMVSTSSSTGPSKDATEGLDRWRETLGLVLSNRSADDVQALNALGKLLSGYGRAEAAHICYLFARSVSSFGGIDDPASSIVLVGSDHLRQPFEFDKEMEPILLSEVFEYGMSLASTGNIAVSYPHLSVYKLQHAAILAEYGYREQALMYCESVASSVTSQTKRSPYHHALLVSALEDLSKRLKQSPKSESSSWLSKPTVSQVSGSVWDKLSKFVAGDEEDTSAGGSTSTLGGSEVGPFARISGGTPTISRSPSNSDLYGGYNGGLMVNSAAGSAASSKTNSRYAPGRTYTPEPQSGGSYVSQPRTSMESRSSGEHQRYQPQRQMSDYRPVSQPAPNSYNSQTNSNYSPQTPYSPYGANDSLYGSQQNATSNPLPTGSYASQSLNDTVNIDPSNPNTPSESTQYGAQPYGYEPPTNSNGSASYGYEPPSSTSKQDDTVNTNSSPPSNTYEPSNTGYEPPSSGYTPYEPTSMGDEPDSPIDTKPRKKSFMDDDDDDISIPKKTSATGEKSKAEKDREAEEAFRKAAEADAQKGNAAPAKKGWGLGGWFGGGKKEAADMSAQPNKPIRAKLGEQSSFYYDPDLKRWINKKGGDTAPTPSATPPPPRAGPPRTASGTPLGAAAPPLRGPPAVRSASESAKGPSPLAQDDGPAASTGDLPSLAPPGPLAMARSASNGSVNGPPSAPPSRPGTGMSNASSIDDLLGPATGGAKRVGAKKKKGRGYIDVMGEKPT